MAAFQLVIYTLKFILCHCILMIEGEEDKEKYDHATTKQLFCTSMIPTHVKRAAWISLSHMVGLLHSCAMKEAHGC